MTTSTTSPANSPVTSPDETATAPGPVTAPACRPFGTLLVANRGEIAVRVLRAAREAGLRTVAVYSDADRDAPHVAEADTAVRLGPAPAAESYLSVPALLAAARTAGADAVHPGYGFLSERAGFARACADAGLVFVGPSADVIDLMGRKDEARRIAVAAGVPVVPALELPSGTEAAEVLEQALAEVGLPLLVKAAAGGGGKGMRIVRSAAELTDALAAARRESMAAFGDDTMLLERYVERGRHIEVQVLADAHGCVLHLFERDCSVQRRHQKVVEEAPAATLPEHVREAVTGAAVRLARHVGYVNAGTVEFLVDGEDFYFLEVNTRLQVEHPVTELVTGLDLVRLQLDVAQGRPLPFGQEDVRLDGHAIEVRVYAEDPDAGFLPQAGTARTVRWPQRARVDEALRSGQQVGTWYDPMLAKVVVHGPDRDAARRRLLAALDATAITGLTTNTGFLRRLTASDAYAAADIDTAWLDRNPGAFPRPEPDVALCAAAWAVADAAGQGHGWGHGQARSGEPHGDRSPFATGDGWRLGGRPVEVAVRLVHDGGTATLRVDRTGGSVSLEGSADAGGSGRRWEVRPAGRAEPPALRLEIDGTVHDLLVEVGAREVTVVHRGEVVSFPRPELAAGGEAAATGGGALTAPMPGTVVAVNATQGQAVSAGDVLVVMEAMKMELPLRSPVDGVVASVDVAVGDRIALGHPVAEVTADGGTG
ncbi:3-methylcrotonyl-CoA carboxylase alpha subunit [Kineococcus xinjiangensis]|uniref:biotin carboxylase n=1 Tax=Kineococcus xinjiangensis TaxID=512762 RepID=A0A2S6IU18_9ACTN|nr:biotin carboxylase N-terminal domain-containing protein [Kineococcus xinjiangensis]PPK97744.1 3-methylcrotonyl-CoA carboxylase alpha subunit [Kineococcus xinjiangensis]